MSDETDKITGRTRTQGKLRASEIRYQRLFETARDGILILGAATRKITDVNPFMVELLGYARAEFLGKELWEIGLLKDKEASQVAFQELQENGHIRYEDCRSKPKKESDGKSSLSATSTRKTANKSFNATYATSPRASRRRRNALICWPVSRRRAPKPKPPTAPKTSFW